MILPSQGELIIRTSGLIVKERSQKETLSLSVS